MRELKDTVHKISSKRRGFSEPESITLDVIIGGSMSPTTFIDATYDDFRNDWGVQFDYGTLQRRMRRKQLVLEGDLGGLVDMNKWDDSGNKWNTEAIKLFRSFYVLPSPAIYLDHTGRKVNFTNFDGEPEYDFLYGINPKSIVH